MCFAHIKYSFSVYLVYDLTFFKVYGSLFPSIVTTHEFIAKNRIIIEYNVITDILCNIFYILWSHKFLMLPKYFKSGRLVARYNN